ncbi:unnamed protein product [Rhizophagus irregularis]|nr:unnamed protein product [Rhizophagus irregularis]
MQTEKKLDMITFSELTPSLTVTEFKINVEGLDYTVLGNKLEPTKDVIAINSNFIHKAFRGRRRTGDGSTFNACIEFVIILADTVHTIRYFPKSGSIQVFGSFDPVAIFLRTFLNVPLPEFSSVELVAYALESVDVFTSKIRVHIWPKSGKVNIFGTKTELAADMIYRFLQKLFSNPNDFRDFICDVPIPDCER